MPELDLPELITIGGIGGNKGNGGGNSRPTFKKIYYKKSHSVGNNFSFWRFTVDWNGNLNKTYGGTGNGSAYQAFKDEAGFQSAETLMK